MSTLTAEMVWLECSPTVRLWLRSERYWTFLISCCCHWCQSNEPRQLRRLAILFHLLLLSLVLLRLTRSFPSSV